jgi:peptidoglycan/LPS O-acetylase OafA/YrhL
MGVLRVLLALSVVVMHCDGGLSEHVLVGGQFAVKLFFIISGFYMALILHEKYTGVGSTKLFYQNRLLRLLPTYYAVIGLAVLLPLAASAVAGRAINLGQWATWSEHGRALPPGVAAGLKWLHLTPFGQEFAWAGYLDKATGVVHFAGAPSSGTGLELFYFMLIPPAWSLSLELQFYLLAPIYVRRPLQLLLVGLGITMGLRWFLPLIPFGSPSFWRNQTLLCELGYFTLGVLSYRLLDWIRQSGRCPNAGRNGWFVLLGMVGLLFAYPWLPTMVRGELTAVALASAIPFIFIATAKAGWDRTLGELSYPLYLGHWLIMASWYGVAAKLKRLAGMPNGVHILLVLLLSTAFAFAIHRLIERPIDRLRQRRVRSVKLGEGK